MLGIGAYKQRMPRAEDMLPGRSTPLPLHNVHFVNGRPLQDAFDGLQQVEFGLGCFWGAERKFWQLGDIGTIDRFGPNGIAWVVDRSATAAKSIQSGYVYTYALIMLLGLVAAVTFVLL